jgi:hypothetical protein
MDLSAAPTAGGLALDLPEGWFHLEADRSVRHAAIQADVRAWAGDNSERASNVNDLVEILSALGTEADEKGALFASAFWEPGEYGPIIANLMVFRGRRTAPQSIEAEIGAALDSLARPDRSDHGPRDVSVVYLPIGPAVRLRFLASAPAGLKASEPALVLDATQVWVPLPADPPMVVVSGTTPCLVAGDGVASAVDSVAASLRSSEPPNHD